MKIIRNYIVVAKDETTGANLICDFYELYGARKWAMSAAKNGLQWPCGTIAKLKDVKVTKNNKVLHTFRVWKSSPSAIKELS